jgi:hypothetical protein
MRPFFYRDAEAKSEEMSDWQIALQARLSCQTNRQKLLPVVSGLASAAVQAHGASLQCSSPHCRREYQLLPGALSNFVKRMYYEFCGTNSSQHIHRPFPYCHPFSCNM